MNWPSKNVSCGGILHPAKSNYTLTNQKLLKGKFDALKRLILGTTKN